MTFLTWALRPFASADTYKALLFYLADLVLGVVGFTLVLAAWPTTLSLAITPLVVPLLIGFGIAVAALARAEAYLAGALLGTEVRSAPAAKGGGFWGRGFSVLKSSAFWKQQLHLLISWPIALVPLCLLSVAVQLLTVPIWYRWADSGDVFWRSNVDTFGETLQFAAVGLAGLFVVVHLLRPMTWLSRRLATRLLSGEAPVVVRSPAEKRVRRLRALTIDALVAASIAFALILVWALTTQGYFWPIWPVMALAVVVGIPGWIVLVLERPEITRFSLGSKALAIQIGISVVLFGYLAGVWAASGGGYFWPIWPALGLALLAVVHGAVVFARREHRIEELETSRAGAVDVQEAELRRIERDLHDGAQARLVALGMSLGMAEQQLETNPAAVRTLLAEARLGAAEALEELRDLARGIRPPILTDRGLEAALAALVARSPVPVVLSVDVRERPPAPVETAAYFTVAEALANAIKHAHASHVDIRIQQRDGLLLAEITDDGDGGADPSGRGITGLRQRVQALDGSLRVESPAGGPTRIMAELPCGS
jgi:signal transduction histidine kinase